MKVKIDILLGEYRKHTRDQVFKLAEIRRDVSFYEKDHNVLKLKIRRRDHFYCIYDVDITGWTFDFIVKENPTDEDSDAIINKHVTILTAPLEGETDIDISAQSGEDFLGNFIYQLQGTNTHGHKMLLAEGLIGFKQSLFG